MKTYERIEAIEAAQATLQQGLEELRAALSGTRDERNYEAYILGHLDNWINGSNPHDDSIPVILENIDENNKYDVVWYQVDKVVGTETIEADTEERACQYAELQASQYSSDGFEVSESVRR